MDFQNSFRFTEKATHKTKTQYNDLNGEAELCQTEHKQCRYFLSKKNTIIALEHINFLKFD